MSTKGTIARRFRSDRKGKRNVKIWMDANELIFVSIEKEPNSGGKMLEEVKESNESFIGTSRENSMVGGFDISRWREREGPRRRNTPWTPWISYFESEKKLVETMMKRYGLRGQPCLIPWPRAWCGESY